jgi:hypothetical protein
MGWEQFTNGALLKEAEEQGFNLFLTTDNNIRYQQNLTNRKIHHSFDRLHKMVAGTAAFRAYSGRSERSHTRELYRSRNSFRLDSRKG